MPADLQFDEKIADAICERLMGGESIIAITRDESMPSQSTVYKWLSRVPSFAERYAHARELQMEAMAQEILDIADDTRNDTRIIKRGDQEIEVENGEWINRCRLQVDTRKWLMSKLAPKKYGDRLDLNHGGELAIKQLVIRPDAKADRERPAMKPEFEQE